MASIAPDRREAPFWEQGYRDMAVSTMGGPNHDIVEILPALPPGARVLDLGAGEGRNAFFLAGHGCRVHAVDLSEAGMRKLATLAERAGLPLTTEVGDIGEHPVGGEWDVVMAHGVIDYLDNPTWHALVERIQAHTVPGGFNAYTCMLFTEEYPAPPEFRRACFKHSVAQYELVGCYTAAEWEVIRHDRYVKWDQHPPNIPIHVHPVDKVVARRPGGKGPAACFKPVPVGEVDLPRAIFDGIDMGLPVAEMHARCGEPAVIDRFTMEGVQLGVGPQSTVDGYRLELWYYGRVVMYVVNGKVWGRALYDSEPRRVGFDTSRIA